MSVAQETPAQNTVARFARPLDALEREQTGRLFDLYNVHQRALGIADSTLRHRAGYLRQALHYLGMPPWEWRASHVDALLAHRALELECSTSAQVSCLQTLRSFQNFLLADLGLCNLCEQQFGCRPAPFVTAANSIAYKRKGNQRSRIITPLTPEHVARLVDEFDFRIACAQANVTKSHLPLCRDKVMVQLALLSGVRVEELVNIRIPDFIADAAYPNFGAFAILRVVGKGAKSRAIRLYNPAIRQIMTWYLEQVRPRFLSSQTQDPQLLFYSERGNALCAHQFRYSLAKAAKGAALPIRVYPHLLRHTYATLMAPVIGPEALQRQLGHRFLSTTLGIYYHQDPANVGNQVLIGIEKVAAQLEEMTAELAS